MTSEKDWIKDLVIYQIYPRSFYDANGDGIGDLPGILQKIDYLEELGVNAIWLSPVYRSPNDDNGYDISGYQEIMEEFGTMEDWDRLRDACREKGIRIIMDLVVNHSSDEHPWFLASRSGRENSKSEYYIWRDPVEGHEPNNWASVFGGSAWEFVPERGQYYFHYFSKKQPDLNWACPQLREEIYQMMDWWVDKGVEGFRVDAISYLDKPQDFPDSAQPAFPDGYSFPDCLAGRPGTHAYIREMNRRIYAPRNVLTVGEVSAPTVEELGNYVRTDREEFDMAIPFVPPEVEIATWSPEKLKHDIQESYEALKEDGWWARFFSNHDKPRQVSLYGDDGQYWEVSAKFLAIFLHSLPGTPFVYQGEEIGMTDVKFAAIEDYNDLGTQNQYRQNLLAGMTPEEALAQAQRESRDNARTPMQWDGSANGGFTTGTPWLKVNPNTKKINVEAQRQDAYSIYQCYRRLIALRKTSRALTHGEMTFLDTGDKELIAFTRSTPEETLLTFHNFSRQEHTIPDELLDGAGEALMSSYDREGGYRGPVLRAYESVIFRMKE
ncbi:MAG: alpha-glucosidase [Lachnospiraceae bacterium]